MYRNTTGTWKKRMIDGERTLVSFEGRGGKGEGKKG